jgi:hypothetical protein
MEAIGRSGSIIVLCLVCGSAATGCKPPLPLVPVTGTVRLGGQPLKDALVVFAPESHDAGTVPVATGRTDAEGRFVLLTNYQPRSTGTGAVPGRHRVTVSKMINAKELPQPAYAKKLAAHRKMVRDLNLQLPYSEGEEDLCYVEVAPEKYTMMTTSPLFAEVVAGRANMFEFSLD